MRHILTALALAAVSIPAITVAQMPKEAPGKADVKRVASSTYAADPSHTVVAWQINHFGFNNYIGLAGGGAGTLKLDTANAANDTVAIELPVSQIITTSAKLTGELAEERFFDAAKYPTVKFVSTKVVANGTSAQIYGDLTLHGVTKPIMLRARFTGAGNNFYTHKDTIGFEATGHINRSEFGMGGYIPLVGDEVQLLISVAFEKAS
jgi:polyisoprenoid-binding protein YceI